jgi:molybdopterin-containing oxidoreductase family iron-sulfur binding subunit
MRSPSEGHDEAGYVGAMDSSPDRHILSQNHGTSPGVPSGPNSPTVPPLQWRSLEEWSASQEFAEFIHREFPDKASEWSDPLTRRQFLTLMGASMALAGLQGCSQAPPETIVPYVRQPEEIVPGQPIFYATAMTLGGYAVGLLAESHMGRPTKIEGNPEHPASLGATDAFAQASILSLYDPDRSKTVTYLGRVRSWEDARTALRAALAAQRSRAGAGLRLLTETVTSPTLARQLDSLLRDFPKAKWHVHDPVGRESVLEGAKLAFGETAGVVYHFDRADVVLSLDADLFGCGPAHLRHVRDFMARRRMGITQKEKTAINRLYVVECTVTTTGAKADHRLGLRPSEIERFARAVAQKLGIDVDGADSPLSGVSADWVEAVARDLADHKGRSIVAAGDYLPPAVHVLAHAINHLLDNIGATVTYTEPIESHAGQKAGSLAELVADMRAGRVELLVILGGNPVYTAPADLEFGNHLLELKAGDADGRTRPPLRFHLSLYQDETSQLCDWHVPEAHFLEAWTDCRAFDGTTTIVQPLILPLYSGKTAHEVLTAMSEQPQQSGYDVLRDYWRARWTELGGESDFESWWRRALHDGFVAGTASAPKRVQLRTEWRTALAASATVLAEPLEIVFRPDPTVFDGRFANNGWLQELPKPLTKLTWDNAALISPATAQRLGVGYKMGWTGGEHGRAIADLVELRLRGRSLQIPVWVVPGQPDDTVTLHLGYGRTRAGQVGNGRGFSAYTIRSSSAPWSDAGVQVVAQSGKTYTLACTQAHQLMENRALVRAATVAEFQANPHFAQHAEHHAPKHAGERHDPAAADEHNPRSVTTQSTSNHASHGPKSLYPPFDYPRYRWAMAIDLTSCVGCGACVAACQAENNIPVVGKDEVTRGREMHWIRIDRYFEGDPNRSNQLRILFQPVPCMHCENAPCEVVCPVGATVHSDEGLNEMVYNRCVGTRYCSNNCPYKVRRFNFFQYADFHTETLKLARNPDVTVRSRGVMEKCTFCVQRINQARIAAEKEDRRIQDGEVLTACQAACPAEAIVFGDLNDPASRISRLKASPLNYALLEDLNTRPRTTYLAAIRNPNPEMGTS